MTPLIMAIAGLAATVALAAGTGGLAIRRYSASHLSVELTIAGRGLYYSRTPDGVWWRLRLWRGRCAHAARGGWSEPPPDAGVREPRRPHGPNPLAAGVELDTPLD